METEIREPKIDALSVEEGQTHGNQNHDIGVATAHTVGQDSWQQVALMLVTSFNSGLMFSYSNFILAPLSWTWGITLLVVLGVYIAYANCVFASFHFIEGKRFIRYRDIMGFLYGKKMYFITWVFQFSTLLLANAGFILYGATALKEMNSESSSSPLRLQYFVIITGVAFFIFSFCNPTMSALRTWWGVSAVLTSICVIAVLSQCIVDGTSSTNRNYDVNGSKLDKAVNSFTAVSAIVLSTTSALFLPEIQSTLREPAVKNMRKALYAQYSVGVFLCFGVTIVGYWAYGSSVSWYLPQNFRGAKWVNIFINTIVFLQFVVSQNIFAAPIHEALDTKYLNLDQRMHSGENIGRLFLLRAFFYAWTAFIAAAFPFAGDFVTLVGALMLIPLTFLFPSMIFIKVRGKTASIIEKIWHWFSVIFFLLLAIVSTMAAIRLIVHHFVTYSLFADI